jgi:hypothetical protein
MPAAMNFRFPNFAHSLLLFVPVVLAVSLMQDWPFTILVALALGIALDSFSYRFPLFYTVCLPLTLFLRAMVPERDLEHNRTIAALTTLVGVGFIVVCQFLLASFSGARTLSTLPFKVNVFGIIACTLLTFLTWRTVLRWFGVADGRYGR